MHYTMCGKCGAHLDHGDGWGGATAMIDYGKSSVNRGNGGRAHRKIIILTIGQTRGCVI